MKDLPVAARIFVGTVLAAGLVILVLFAPHSIGNPLLFAALLSFSALASALKVSLPLATSGSTMSVSYAVDFAALLLLGANETMIVAAASAYSQCTFRTQARSDAYRTLFSMASLVVTVKAAGLVYVWLGGTPPGTPFTILAIPKPLVGAATTYFVCNTALIATAIALSTKQPLLRVWNENFLWSAPSYFVGAGAAAIAATIFEGGGYWFALLAAAPPYFIYRTYKVYMGRIEDEQRHVLQTSDLHLATIEALARAIDAKDQTTHMHLRRVQFFAAELARAGELSLAEQRANAELFASATGDIIITLDGDHSYPPDAISYLIEAILHLDVDFLNASRFPVRDRRAMSFKHKFGNWVLSLAMSLLYFQWVRDSQSGMWVFRRSILSDMKLVSDGMAFSEEIKIEALKSPKVRFGEISILYTSRLGEIKLNPWRDGFQNLWFLVKKRFS